MAMQPRPDTTQSSGVGKNVSAIQKFLRNNVGIKNAGVRNGRVQLPTDQAGKIAIPGEGAAANHLLQRARDTGAVDRRLAGYQGKLQDVAAQSSKPMKQQLPVRPGTLKPGAVGTGVRATPNAATAAGGSAMGQYLTSGRAPKSPTARVAKPAEPTKAKPGYTG